MVCPACQGHGYRILYIGADEGICPACGGAGSVQEKTEGGAESHSWTFNYVPCRDCGGRGIKPIRSGGVRDGMVVVASGQDYSQPSGEYDESAEEETKDKEEPSGEGSFMSRYRMYLMIGGGALLVVALVAMQTSKKKR
jgi:RecJ-like exonuclease